MFSEQGHNMEKTKKNSSIPWHSSSSNALSMPSMRKLVSARVIRLSEEILG